MPNCHPWPMRNWKAMLQTNTGEADLRDLHASLVATPLKLRMRAYVASRE